MPSVFFKSTSAPVVMQTASVLPLPLHKFGFIFGGMSMFGGIPDSGHFLEYRAFYGWVFSAIAPLYINSGRPYPGRVEALVVVLPGLCYGIVSLLYLYRIDFFKDNLPEVGPWVGMRACGES